MTETIVHRNHGVRIIGLIVVCVALLANTLPNEFVWDDIYLITKNPYIRSCKNIGFFFTPTYWNHLHTLKTKDRVQYRPVRTSTFAIDYHFWRLNPAGYHLTNLVLHTFCVILVYYFVGFIIAGAEYEHPRGLLCDPPFLTALFFAVHPVHTESIAFIKNRADILACLFFLMAFICFIRSFYQNKKGSRLLIFMAAIVSFALAILSKETALVLPAVLVFYGVCFSAGKERFVAVLKTIPFWGVTVIYFVFRQTVLATSLETAGSDTLSLGAEKTFLLFLQTIGRYLSLLFFPVNLNANHFFPFADGFFNPEVIFPAVALFMVCLLIVLSYKRSPYLCFGTGWIFLTLLPVSNLIFLSSRPIAEQRLYLPSLGFCLILSTGIRGLSTTGHKFFGRSDIAAMLIVLAVFVFGSVQTFLRNNDWQTRVSFWRDCVNKSPRSSRSICNLGLAYCSLGLTSAGQDNYPQAHRYFTKALNVLEVPSQRFPDYYDAFLYNQGIAYNGLENYGKALSCLKASLDLRLRKLGENHHQTAQTYHTMGLVYQKTGALDDAANCFAKALRIQKNIFGPDHPETAQSYNDLGVIWGVKKDYAKATVYLKKALAAKQSCGGCLSDVMTRKIYSNLGFAFYQQNHHRQAIMFYHMALRLFSLTTASEKLEVASIYNNLGAAYQGVGNIGLAKKYVKKGLMIRRKELGLYHPYTQFSQKRLEYLGKRLMSPSK